MRGLFAYLCVCLYVAFARSNYIYLGFFQVKIAFGTDRRRQTTKTAVGGPETSMGKIGSARKRKTKSFFSRPKSVYAIENIADQKKRWSATRYYYYDYLSSVAVVPGFFDSIFQARDRYRYGLEDGQTKADHAPDTTAAGRYERGNNSCATVRTHKAPSLGDVVRIPTTTCVYI